MNTPTFSNVVSQTRMMPPEVTAPAPSGAEQLLSQPFVAPVMTMERPAHTFIPDDLDLSDLKAPAPTGFSALLGAKMSVPNMVRPETMADHVLKMQIPTPTLRAEDPVRAFIPADVDLSVEPQQARKPDGFDRLLQTPFTPPVMVKPQTVAERVLSTKMTLPGGSFSQAVALTVDTQKHQARAFQPEP